MNYIADYDNYTTGSGTTERYFYSDGSGFDVLPDGRLAVYDSNAQIDVVLAPTDPSAKPMLKDAATYHSYNMVSGG